MKRSGIATLIVGVAHGFLAGCSSQAGEAPSDPGAQERTSTNEDPSISRPPDSTLAYGGRTVTGELGSYCWTLPGSPATCTDAAGIPVARDKQTLANRSHRLHADVRLWWCGNPNLGRGEGVSARAGKEVAARCRGRTPDEARRGTLGACDGGPKRLLGHALAELPKGE